ncbi:MAG: NAD(P)/FAD-dependent oxidoreductase [Acutalibacteraceae bacterium]|nr:NAD(P)/FAD-dependent oxidoreductase [Acutalibacteraceae bacterium]
MYDVLIIGAGVIGGMVARTLAKYDLKICILEKENDVAMGATKANSAIVHAGFDAKEGSLKARLNIKGSAMMESVCKELGVKYKNNGSLVIGFNDDDRATIEELKKRGDKGGVPALRVLEKDELLTLEPNLSRNVTCALYAPSGAIVCPYELTVAAIGNAMDNGAELICNFPVTDIEKIDGGFMVKSCEKSVSSRYVINCAGLFSDKIAAMVGDESFSVHPRRGEYILLDKECGGILNHTVFRTPSKMGKGILVSPTVDGNLLLGPTSVDIEDKDDKTTTAEGFQKIIKEANENVNGLDIRKTITSFCGLRAVGSTGDFIINSPIPHFINAAGIESPGLSASPAIAMYIENLLRESGLILNEKSDYEPTRPAMHRFREASIEEKNEIIKKDRTYGKIVCRCETVTEGEILEAIRRNPKPRDLDGVKRRTRAQMGRCQGGFCGPYIVELLAREQNIPFEDVTKSGGNSYVNLGKTKEAAKND